MPRDFKSFAKDNQKNKSNEQEFLNQADASKYEDILNKYKNMSQSDLMSNLFTEANKLKKEGKLNEDTLNTLQSTLSPFLNTEQQEMLKNLINALNEQK